MVERSRRWSLITGGREVGAAHPDLGELPYVFNAGQNVARQPSDLRAVRRGLRAASCGSGMSEIQARASAIGEAIERSSGCSRRRAARRATLAELETPPSTQRAHALQRAPGAMRRLVNLGASSFSKVFDPFEEEKAIDWSPVWSVTHERTRWLPTASLLRLSRSTRVMCRPRRLERLRRGDLAEDAALQGFVSWSSAIAWRSGGTTARAVRHRSRQLRGSVHRSSAPKRMPASAREVGARPHGGPRHPGCGRVLRRTDAAPRRTSSSRSAPISIRGWRCCRR